METSSFGLWLRQRRRILNMTQEALAQCAGCSVSAIRKIEADERRPSLQVAELLAGCLKIDPAERPTFLQVARAELRVNRLSGVAEILNPESSAVYTSPGPLPQPPLPVPATPLLGREHELAGIAHLLANPECRMLTLIGPGGIGKTRLALETAAKSGRLFGEGVYFVSLAPLDAADYIVPTIAAAMGIVLEGQADPQAQLLHHLRDRQLLLVLDNFEHLLRTIPNTDNQGIDLLVNLLQQTSTLKLLVTSRERLNLQSEWIFEVQGLPVPPSTQVEHLMGYSAMALFLQSARRSRVGFELTPAEQPFVVRICELVEGLPLGIELAAAWVRLLSCREIAQEIERSLDFLATSQRDAPARHRSLRVVFDYSWGLLPAEEQQVLRRLSVFRGGIEREAAGQVAGASLPLLSALLDRSLLRRSTAGYYNLHELVRQYAQEQLRAAEEWDQGHDRHLTYFMSLAEEAEFQLEGPEQVTWSERLEQERDNIRAALTWAFAEAGEPGERVEAGLRLAGALYRFWQGRGHLQEGCTWLERGLDYSDMSAVRVRAKALNVLGWLINQQGNHLRATVLIQESLALHRQLGDNKGTAYALDSLGDVAWLQGDFEQARAYYQESLALCRVVGDQWAVGMSLCSLGRLHLDHGYHEQAAVFLEESLVLLRQLADRRGIALSLLNLGRVSLYGGDYEQSTGQIRESLVLFQELGNKVDMAECFQVLASLARRQGQAGRTARLWAAAGALFESLEIPPISALNRAAYTEDMAFAHTHLDDMAFTAAWNEGKTMPLDQAIAYALADS